MTNWEKYLKEITPKKIGHLIDMAEEGNCFCECDNCPKALQKFCCHCSEIRDEYTNGATLIDEKELAHLVNCEQKFEAWAKRKAEADDELWKKED